MEKIKTYLDYSFRVFDIATMKGIYLLLFIGAGIYLMLTEKEHRDKNVQKLLLSGAIAIILLLSPLLGAFAGKQVDTRVLRLYWAIPFEFVVLYCIVDILFRFKEPLKKGVFICAVLLGIMALSRQDNLTYPKVEQRWPWTKAENLYKIPQPVYELCNIIKSEQNGEACRAVFPFEYAYYVRQYDASIDLPYSFYWEPSDVPCFDAINADEIDLDEVGETTLDEDLDYIVVDKNKIARGSLEKYNYAELDEVQAEDTTYVIYQRVQ
jgi:hypothetical protein